MKKGVQVKHTIRYSNFGERLYTTYFLIRARLFPEWALHQCCFEIPISISHIYDSYCDCCINACPMCGEDN